MSLKAKLEAVIYAAEEPVTLTQLAALFAADALEWKAAQQAAADEAAAEIAGEPTSDPMPLLAEGLQYLEIANDLQTSEAAPQDPALAEAETPAPAEDESASMPEAAAPPAEGSPAEEQSPDPEAEARRLSRQRERDIKGVIKQLIDELISSYESDARGIEIREIAGGYRMATKPEYHDAVRIFVKSLKPPLKLSLPALETLAVVAYKQPVTAPEVNEIRGVESAGVLGSLLARKLIATAGRKPVIGRPILYKTTREFLLRFGLKDVAELPSMEEFEKMAAAEIEEMEPEAAAADAAEDAAEEANLEANSPSGIELAGAAEAGIETQADAAAETSSENSTPSNQQNAVDEARQAPPAEPEAPPPAENEIPDAEKVQQER